MKVVFMGTPDFAVATLEALIEAKHEVAAVITQPDKPKGRGKELAFSAVKQAAVEHDLKIYQPEKVKDSEFIKEIQDIAPDVIVVVAFGQILPKEILDIPKFGCINVHASLLPKYRGAAPIQWAVINGEKETGITTMYMSEGLDTGDIIEQSVVPVAKDETGGSLFDKLALEGGCLLLSTLKKLQNHTAKRIPQNDEESSYAKILKKEMGKIDWTQSAIDLERLIRGLNPWPSAYTFFQGKMLKIWKAEVTKGNEEIAPGTIVEVGKHDFTVQTGEYALRILELQLAGKKRMESDAFLRGYQLTAGQKLGDA